VRTARDATRAVATALRVLVWAVLYAVAVRALAMGVGIWAAGTLTAASTLLVALVVPAWLFLHFPGWLAWRVALPLRSRPLVRAACWLSPLVRARDLRSVAIFLDVDAGHPLPSRSDLPADAWTALAAVREADRLGDDARAHRIVDALAHLPAGARFPLLARRYGVERLVAAAVRRGDLAAASRYAALGVGPLPALLAALGGGAEQGARPPRLWLHWAAAPCRRLTLPLVRAAASRPRLPRTVTAPAAPLLLGRGADDAPAAPVALRHLQLLAAAARGPVQAADVFALAGEWERALDDGARARVHARALELGARQGDQRAEALRDAVVAELVVMADRAEGEPAGAGVGEGPIVCALRDRVRSRLLERVEAAMAPLGEGRRSPPRNVLDAWERFLAVRVALDRAEAIAGQRAVAALWYGGVRDAVWSWSCALFHDGRARSGWAAHVMFDWVADRAELYGDFPATLLNRENARSALSVA
jgi:hypothetical protein